MGYAKLAIYMAGVVVVVLAVWVFLTQTDIGRTVPAGISLALMLLLVGIGIMAAARSINDRRVTSRVTHDSMGGPSYVERAPPAYVDREPTVDRTVVRSPPSSGETIVEERRYD